MKTVVILGAGGRVGNEIAKAFVAAGWRVEAEGVRCVVTDTIMRIPATSAALARTCLEAVS